ncbi:hypothetical protein N9992_00300 [bacterium]|jgi:hypothetical protein|nr:hypothetical protein [bacterium]|tara:strand:- start:1514 stop:1738 length:225 start_codon:yes stop_codon:yes gene_type:complete
MCQELFLRIHKKELDLCLYFRYNICYGEKIMDIDIAYLIVLVASVHLAYMWGKKEGISSTLDYMKEQGKIDFED